MAHKEQIEYCNQIKKLYPEYFDGVYILDAGSLDINGNNQYLFTNSHYIGVDIGEGKNVDIISKIHELQLPDHTFDTIISTEVFEHDQYYTESIKNIYRMLKPGGMFLFTCATTGRSEHGTSRTKPQDAPLIQNDKEWQDYYKNLTEDDIKEIFNLNDYFYKYQFMTNQDSYDLYFYGIKSGTWQKRTNRSFHIYNHIYNNKDYIQLFVDTGSGFNEQNSNKIELKNITKENILISFYLKKIYNIQAIKLNPLNNYCLIELKNIFLEKDNDSKIDLIQNISSNAIYKTNNIYYFDNKKPEIYFNNLLANDLVNSKRLVIELKYLNYGDEALRVCIKKLKNDLLIQHFTKNFNSKVIFFGASSALSKKFNLLKKLSIIPDYICDNDIEKHGKEVESYIIHNPEILFNQDEEFIVIITSSFIDEIKSQLSKYPNIKAIFTYNEICYKLRNE